MSDNTKDVGATVTLFREDETLLTEDLTLTLGNLGYTVSVTDNSDCGRAAEELKISEKRYRTLLENLGVGIFVLGLDGVLSYVSSLVAGMAGYDEVEEFISQPIERLYPEISDQERIIREIREKGSAHMEIPAVRKDGTTYWVSMSAVFRKNENGQPLQVIGMVKDITARKKAEDALRNSQEQLQTIFDASPAAIFLVNREGRITRANQRMGDLFCRPSEELVGAPYVDMLHPEQRSIGSAKMRALIAGEIDHVNLERRYLKVNGVEFLGHLSGRRLLRPDGDLEGLLGIITDITEQRKAEDALRLSEERFRLVYESGMLGMGFCDPDGRIVDANDTYLSMIRRSRDDLVHNRINWREITPPEHLPSDLKAFDEIIAHGRCRPYEKEYRLDDGARVSVIIGGALLSGSSTTAIAFALDISDRKEAANALRESEEKYRLIFEYSPLGVFHFDHTGTITACNDNFTRIIGSPRDLLIGLNMIEQLGDKSMVAAVRRALEGGIGHYEDYYRSITAHKNTPVKCEFGPILSEEGNILGGIGIVEDITERKKAEEDLQRSEEKYRKILETIADGYHEVDLHGNLTLVNDSLCEIMGYAREELLGLNYRRLVDPADLTRVFEAYNHVHQTGSSNPELTYDIIRGDGAKRTVSVSISLLRDSTGIPIGFCGIFRDETEKKLLEQRLREAAKMEAIGRLAGSIAHDFNNLLTAIIGYASILKNQLAERGIESSKLDRIHQCSERAADLTRQLLAYSRRQVLEMKVLALNDMVRDMESLLRRLIGETIELNILFDPELGNVRADSSQLTQIFMNLAVNARDAMPRGGSLTIETRTMVMEDPVADSTPEMEPGRYVMLSVGDTGEGMDGDTLSKIFDPFFTTKGENAGTGLGLSTVYGIVKQHGGHITVDSELGSGTVFRIYLPLIEDAVAPGLGPCTRLGTPGGTETILLVEDEEAVRNLTGEALEIFGYKVLKAASPGEAIALSRDHSDYIHLLLTDVILPQMDGKSLFEVIKRERPDIKALFMSGYTENFIVHHGVLDPEVNFIPKPFVIEGLGHKVREILDPDKKPSET